MKTLVIVILKLQFKTKKEYFLEKIPPKIFYTLSISQSL